MAKPQSTLPRWVIASLVGVFAVFAGTSLRIVLAASFTEPSCDPTVDKTCNVDKPIFSNTTTPTTAQVISTPLTIGASGTPKDVGLYGNFTLNAGSKLQTAVGGIAGQAVNVASTADSAIIATTASTQGAIKAITTNAAGVALYASNSAAGGNAATFDGPLRVNGISTLNGATNITGDVVITSGSLTVGGELVGAATSAVVSGTFLAADTTKEWSISAFGVDSTKTVTGYSAMYSVSSADGQRVWLPVQQANVKYIECDPANAYVGKFNVTHPNAGSATSVKIVVQYQNVAAECSLTPVISDVVSAAGNTLKLADGNYYQAPNNLVTFRSNVRTVDASTTWEWRFGSWATCSGTDENAACSASTAFATVSGTLKSPVVTMVDNTSGWSVPVTLRVTGVATIASATFLVYHPGFQVARPSDWASNFTVLFSNSSARAGTTPICEYDADNNGTWEGSICGTVAVPYQFTYGSIGAKTLKFRIKAGPNSEFAEIQASTSPICTQTSGQCTSPATCQTGFCVAVGGG